MKVAVIIVNFNDSEDTIRYVRQITKYEKINRIVVVDNCSTEQNEMKRLSELENEKVVILQSDKNGGYNYGNNFGINYLREKGEKYDYFIISNPDIEIEEEAIIQCLECLEKDKNIAIAAPRMLGSTRKTSSSK